jgi:hypothetical protein
VERCTLTHHRDFWARCQTNPRTLFFCDPSLELSNYRIRFESASLETLDTLLSKFEEVPSMVSQAVCNWFSMKQLSISMATKSRLRLQNGPCLVCYITPNALYVYGYRTCNRNSSEHLSNTVLLNSRALRQYFSKPLKHPSFGHSRARPRRTQHLSVLAFYLVSSFLPEFVYKPLMLYRCRLSSLLLN